MTLELAVRFAVKVPDNVDLGNDMEQIIIDLPLATCHLLKWNKGKSEEISAQFQEFETMNVEILT